MNLTDVDDRIIQKAAAAGVSIRDYTEKYIQAYLDDRRALNLEPPEHIARATEHIDDMVTLIQRLTEKGFTYTSDGSIYFRISKFPAYGKLSKIDVAGMQAGARVDVDRYDKDNARDFALWKAPKPGEHFWETRDRTGTPRLAHRVLRHGHEISRRHARHPQRRRRPDLSSSRERNRAVRSGNRKAVRALLAPCRAPAGGS